MTDKELEQSDWREDYIICEHIADETADITEMRHRQFRVCCAKCYDIKQPADHGSVSRFLFDENIRTERRGNLTVGFIAEDTP